MRLDRAGAMDRLAFAGRDGAGEIRIDRRGRRDVLGPRRLRAVLGLRRPRAVHGLRRLSAVARDLRMQAVFARRRRRAVHGRDPAVAANAVPSHTNR